MPFDKEPASLKDEESGQELYTLHKDISRSDPGQFSQSDVVTLPAIGADDRLSERLFHT